jgi:hypothetical protein
VVSELVRTLVLCGLLSGTQPVTLMGLLLVMTGPDGRRNGLAFIAGAFLVESAFLLGASVFLGNSVESTSAPGRTFLAVRMLVGVVLIGIGLRLRRPPKHPSPDVPKSLARLTSMNPRKSFLAGLALADYQGPILGSLAIASSPVSGGGRLLALALFTTLATGIPVTILIVATRSPRAHQKLGDATTWVMHNRRRLGSVITIVMGTLLIGDAALGLLLH